ncbi:hypothetical protein [Virgibacillus proomii]|uniref:hypothetical protein n=1 Tax=Virgibacillus proomii TaxID=84407 RepID=UPI00098647C7|nr:hypothetical protein [Virgibacillus proomii]
MNKTYYFVEFEYIDIPPEGFHTNQQLTIKGTKFDADPITILKVVENDYYEGWIHLQAIHETVDKTPRRMAGDPEYLHQSIVGGDRPFNCYYKKDENIMILNTSKKNVIGLQRALIQHFPDRFKPYQHELEFKKLLKKLSHTQIVSSWFNNIQGKVNAVGLYGRRVNFDEIFDHYNELGRLSAITVEWQIKDETQPINVMFTKNYGVIIYSDWPFEKDLYFLLEIKKLLFSDELIKSS